MGEILSRTPRAACESWAGWSELHTQVLTKLANRGQCCVHQPEHIKDFKTGSTIIIIDIIVRLRKK